MQLVAPKGQNKYKNGQHWTESGRGECLLQLQNTFKKQTTQIEHCTKHVEDPMKIRWPVRELDYYCQRDWISSKAFVPSYPRSFLTEENLMHVDATINSVNSTFRAGKLQLQYLPQSRSAFLNKDVAWNEVYFMHPISWSRAKENYGGMLLHSLYPRRPSHSGQPHCEVNHSVGAVFFFVSLSRN